MTEVTRHFQDGWVGAQRDDAVFMFAQQRAVMIASGSWDAQSIVSQAGGRFRVGVFDFPLPVDHPDYGRYVKGPPTEANIRGGIPWCVNARTRFPDLCIDFLRFCTTPERNARFNRSITWIPVLRGATLSDELKPFKPRIHGFYGHFNYYISPATRLIGEGNRWTLYAGGQSPADYGRELADIYERTAADGYREQLQRQRHHGRNLQRVLAALGASRLYADTRLDADLRTKAIQVLHSVQGNAGYVARNEGPFLALETRRRRSEDSR
jgi:raffinose/stachyose/melibiose transport system substrate-binding protein